MINDGYGCPAAQVEGRGRGRSIAARKMNGLESGQARQLLSEKGCCGLVA